MLENIAADPIVNDFSIHFDYLSYSLFCYILSKLLYLCLSTPSPTTGDKDYNFSNANMNFSNVNEATGYGTVNNVNVVPVKPLRDIKMSNVNRLIIGQLYIKLLNI